MKITKKNGFISGCSRTNDSGRLQCYCAIYEDAFSTSGMEISFSKYNTKVGSSFSKEAAKWLINNQN